MSSRYARQQMLPEIGPAGQAKLGQAKVLVIGAGGLGCPALQYLAAAGIGHFGIVDPDRVDESNLHRQILYTIADIGTPKAIAAARRLQAINPDCTVDCIEQRLTAALADELVRQYDIVVDGTDNFAAKYALSDACLAHQKPLVSASAQGFAGYVACFCAGAPSYRALFPEAATGAPTCANAGVLNTAPGLFGVLQATEVIKIILGIGESLQGRILHVDLLTMRINTFSFATAPEPQEPAPEAVALVDVIPPGWQILDVREAWEFERGHIPAAWHIPLPQLPARLQELPNDQPLLVYCQGGGRGDSACRLLQQHGFVQVANLAGGFMAWRGRAVLPDSADAE